MIFKEKLNFANLFEKLISNCFQYYFSKRFYLNKLLDEGSYGEVYLAT